MTNRVCFIGNSHLAALKLAWDELPAAQRGGVEATFFGSLRDFMKRLKADGPVLLTDDPQLRESLGWTSHGRSEIDTREYDAFVLVALDWSFAALARMFGRYRTIERTGEEPQPRHIVSTECFEAARNGVFDNSVAVDVARKLRAVTNKPIIFVPEPMRSISIIGTAEKQLWTAIAAEHGAGAELRSFFHRKLFEFGQSYDLTIALQPENTLANPLFTNETYSVGSVRLGPTMALKHHADEHGHMNAAFGTITLQQVLPLTTANVRAAAVSA